MKEKKENGLVLADSLKSIATADITAASLASNEFSEQYFWLQQACKQLTDLKAQVDEKIKSVVEEEFLNTGNQNIKSDILSFAFVPNSIRETVDTKRFKKEQPDLYKQYVRTSSVKSSLRVTPIKDKDKIGEGEDDA